MKILVRTSERNLKGESLDIKKVTQAIELLFNTKANGNRIGSINRARVIIVMNSFMFIYTTLPLLSNVAASHQIHLWS